MGFTRTVKSKMKAIISLLTLSIAVYGDLEIAPYEVIQESDGWEVRMFPAQKWISTDVQDVMPHDGPEHDDAFFRLFNYIDGSNEMNSKIPMTAPVSMRILPGEGPNCESNYTMSFYIPSNLQENPPKPTDSQVYIEERQAFEVVAMQFGGFPSDLEFSAKAAMLYEMAKEEELSVKDVPLWTAGFSGPSVIINRRNEVWLEL